jgi:hypothetical protein
VGPRVVPRDGMLAQGWRGVLAWQAGCERGLQRVAAWLPFCRPIGWPGS